MRRLRLTGGAATVAKVASLAMAGFLVAVILGNGAAGALLTVLDEPTVTGPELSLEKTADEHVFLGAVFDYTLRAATTHDGIQVLTAGGGNDTLEGNDGLELMVGGAGDDRLEGLDEATELTDRSGVHTIEANLRAARYRSAQRVAA